MDELEKDIIRKHLLSKVDVDYDMKLSEIQKSCIREFAESDEEVDILRRFLIEELHIREVINVRGLMMYRKEFMDFNRKACRRSRKYG